MCDYLAILAPDHEMRTLITMAYDDKWKRLYSCKSNVNSN